jgi:hypothetical protein
VKELQTFRQQQLACESVLPFVKFTEFATQESFVGASCYFISDIAGGRSRDQNATHARTIALEEGLRTRSHKTSHISIQLCTEVFHPRVLPQQTCMHNFTPSDRLAMHHCRFMLAYLWSSSVFHVESCKRM